MGKDVTVNLPMKTFGKSPLYGTNFFMLTRIVFHTQTQTLTHGDGCPRGVMVKALYCGIVVSEFELQSPYYFHFRANSLGKGMKPLILPAMG